ncbi:hypothetical protein NEUTE2DRAFT_73576 [Neurospora tetrasperma FGSC 2509]|nr:hypothetical protein NEUTE2DRAFT_73576 [Neurospora tetrasperma FGSC 2509]
MEYVARSLAFATENAVSGNSTPLASSAHQFPGQLTPSLSPGLCGFLQFTKASGAGFVSSSAWTSLASECLVLPDIWDRNLWGAIGVRIAVGYSGAWYLLALPRLFVPNRARRPEGRYLAGWLTDWPDLTGHPRSGIHGVGYILRLEIHFYFIARNKHPIGLFVFLAPADSWHKRQQVPIGCPMLRVNFTVVQLKLRFHMLGGVRAGRYRAPLSRILQSVFPQFRVPLRSGFHSGTGHGTGKGLLRYTG